MHRNTNKYQGQQVYTISFIEIHVDTQNVINAYEYILLLKSVVKAQKY